MNRKEKVKNMKKIMAVLTSFVVLASMLCQTVTFAAFSDVDDANPYKKAITTLSKLSVIDGYTDGTFKPDGQITRAEFTKLIVYTLGHKDLTYSTNEFTDVSNDHWAKNFIQTAYNLGIIAGFGDGIFAPDQQVTYEQALKMVVCTLGYEQFAQGQQQTTDDWAEKYIKEANVLGLTKNITGASYKEGASRGVIAQVIYNALDIDMYENNNYEWLKTEKTLMKDYLKVREAKGTLVGVDEYVTEECKSRLGEDEMCVLTNAGEELVINFSEYSSSVTDINKYLGKSIIVFYRQQTDDDERMLVIIDDESTQNSQIDINYEDINSFSGNSLKYYDSNKKLKTIKFKDKDLTVRYNGKTVSTDEIVTLKNPVTKQEETFTRQEALEQWLNPDTPYSIYGSIVLTDNANDSTIDMIQINDYDVIVAYAVPTTSDYRITDKLVTGNYLILDPESPDYTYTITKNGAEIPVTSIAANDVILYAKSLDDSLYTLIVSNQTVKGSITSINSSNDRMTINGTTYNIGEKCASYIKDKEGKELKAGVSGTFYLDNFGTAIYGTLEQAVVSPYAYIANAYIDNEGGEKGYITVYAPSVSSTLESYPIKDKVKFNGVTRKDEDVIEELYESSKYTNDDVEIEEKIYGAGKSAEITDYSQPARITITNGEVTDIVTLQSDEIKAQNDDKEQIVKCKSLDKYTYSSNGFNLGGKSAFSVNSSTVVLCVPGTRMARDKYAKKTTTSAFTSGDSYYVEAYDISSSKVAGLVILYGNESALTPVKKDTDFSIVASLPENVYNEKNDKNVLEFEVFAGASNSVKKWTTFDNKEFSDVQVGDVIQFAHDSDNLAQGRINNIKFEDIAEVLDAGEEVIASGEEAGDIFNWDIEQEPTEENNNQLYKFDYRFKVNGTSTDEVYTSTSLGTVPYSRACMYNVSQILTDDKKIYVTKNAFKFNEEENRYVLDDSDYEEIAIASTTKILRMEDERDEISKYASNTTTEMTMNDLRDAKNYGVDCSKILVCSSKGVAKLIVVYN